MSEWRSDLERAVAAQVREITEFRDVRSLCDAGLGKPAGSPSALVSYERFVANESIVVAASSMIVKGYAIVLVNLSVTSGDSITGTARLNAGGGYDLAHKSMRKLMGFCPALSGLSDDSGAECVWEMEFRQEDLFIVPNSGVFEIEQTYHLPMQIHADLQT